MNKKNEEIKEGKKVIKTAAGNAKNPGKAPENKAGGSKEGKENGSPKTKRPVRKASETPDGKKKILFVSSEAAPFITTGGLGEVVGSLPKHLHAEDKDIDVRVVIPLYDEIVSKYKEQLEFVGKIYVDLGWRHQYCGVFKAVAGDIVYYFIDNEYYFKRADCYGFFDDGERFAFFGKAVLDILGMIDFIPDIIHLHDWQSAIVAVYLKTTYAGTDELKNVKTIFTIHNIAYQGKYNMSMLEGIFDIPFGYKNILEFDGAINLMKGAMICSDITSTVSQTYAKEIQDFKHSCGLEPIIYMQKARIRGIFDGIDIDYKSYCIS